MTDKLLQRTGTTERKPILIASGIRKQWLDNTLTPITSLHLAGELRDALDDLTKVGREKKLFLPTASLNAAIAYQLGDVLGMDRDLGLKPPKSNQVPPSFLDITQREVDAELRQVLVKTIRRWSVDVLAPWAERRDWGQMAERVRMATTSDSFTFTDANRRFKLREGRYDLPLLVRAIVGQLAGQELFEDLGPCRVVFPDRIDTNHVDLITAPQMGERHYFSMVATLGVVTIPYSSEIYLRVGAMKRNWYTGMPKTRGRGQNQFTAYAFAPGDAWKPVVPVSIVRGKEGWEYSEDYPRLVFNSEGEAPRPLAETVSQVPVQTEGDPGKDVAPEMKHWWLGVPMTTHLFSSIPQRTVFEADEVSLLQRVRAFGQPILTESEIPLQVHKLPRGGPGSEHSVLGAKDLGLTIRGAAEDTEEPPEEEEQSGNAKMAVFREQNIKILRELYPLKPILWAFGGGEREIELIRKSVEALFGDAVDLRPEPLPEKVHGTREQLDEAEKNQRQRFDARVKRWKEGVKMPDVPGRHAIVCAAAEYNGRPEDPVNYYAGINALASMGASVHHVLPIDGTNDEARLHFAQRLQSALLDVFFAHSGKVLGVGPFMKQLFGDRSPKYVYGVQTVRSNARAFTGEGDTAFIAYTRLPCATGVTEISFVGEKTARTPWMLLADGLRWLAAQRGMEGSTPWLRNVFTAETKKLLTEILADDPHAMMLLDWGTLDGGVWKGISDQDLATGKPRLDDVDLAARFPGMYFARIRRGSSTMALRSMASVTYEGFVDGEVRQSSGERVVDLYATTSKSIVQVGHVPKGTFGHFIGAMGYQHSNQPRGISCYRTVMRVSPIKEGASNTGTFKRRALQPAGKDVSVPAPLDVTVLHAPTLADVPTVAKAVIGLRLGYAHFGDWTSMPAPLFFRRKIDDHIIRFPGDAEEVPATAKVEEPQEFKLASEPEDLEPSAATDSVVADALGETLGLEQKSVPAETPNPEPAAAPVEAPVSAAPKTAPVIDDPLVARFREARMPILHRDHKGLYSAMLRPDMPVVAELPSFVTEKALFIQEEPRFKRYEFKEYWQKVTSIGYAKGHLQTGPEFYRWHLRRLSVPQAGYYFDSVYPDGNLFRACTDTVARMSHYLEEKGIEPLADFAYTVAQIMSAAHDENCDEELSWLIFFTVHFPGSKTTETREEVARRVVTKIPGPLTRQAIEYYLRSVDAVNDAIAAYAINKRFPKISRRITHTPTISSPAAAKPVSASEVFMDKRRQLIDIINALDEGAPDFEVNLEKARGLLADLQELESKRRYNEEVAAADARAEKERLGKEKEVANQAVEELRIAQARAAEAAARVELLKALYAKIASHPLASESDDHNLTGLHMSATDVSELVLADITKAADKMFASYARYEGLNALPATAKLKERAAIAKQIAEQLDIVHVDLAALHAMLDRASFSPEIGPTDAKPAARAPAVAAPQTPPGAALVATPAKVDTSEKVTVAGELPRTAPKTEQIRVHDEEPAHTPDLGLLTDERKIELLRALHKLINERHYGLAGVHMDAMRQVVPGEVFGNHATLCSSLFSALDSLDCMFEPSAMIPGEVVKLTKLEHPFTPADEASELHSCLGILASSISAVLFLDASTASNEDSEARELILNFLERRFAEQPELKALVEALWRPSHQNIPVTRTMLSAPSLGLQAANKNEIVRMQERAANWYDDESLSRKKNHQGFQKIHREIFQGSHPIADAMRRIARGDAAGLRANWQDSLRRFESRAIDEAARNIGEKGRLDGKFRNLLADNIVITQKFAERYLELTSTSRANSSLSQREERYVSELFNATKAAETKIKALPEGGPLERIYRQCALTVLGGMLKLFDDKKPAACIPARTQRFFIQKPLTVDGIPVYDRNEPATDLGLCTPLEVLAETERLSEEGLPAPTDDTMRDALYDAIKAHQAHSRWFAASALELTANGGKLSPETVSALAKERQNLISEMVRADARAAHARSLSAITEADYSKIKATISDIKRGTEEGALIGDARTPYTLVPDFPQARAILRLRVTEVIEKALEQTRAKLKRDLAAYLAEKPDRKNDVRRIEVMVESNNPGSVRAAKDAYDQLKRTDSFPMPPKRLNVADDFSNFCIQLRASTQGRPLLDGMVGLLKNPAPPGAPDWVSVSAEERASTLELVQKWQAICAPSTSNKTEDHLNELAGILGFRSGLHVMGAPAARRVEFHWSDSTPFPVAGFVPPDLGSTCKYAQGFLLRGADVEQELRAITPSISSPTLVMYSGYLTMEKRGIACANRQVLLLDDFLVAFLAIRNRSERARTFLNVALLNFRASPYGDYNTRPVPREMFYGREDELEQLRNVKGSAVLYGGRRLGKSSLLDKIVSETRSLQSKGQYAVIVNLDGLTEDDIVKSAWERILKVLTDRQLIEPMRTGAKNATDIINYISAQLSRPNSSVRSLFLMLDEADKLMQRDLQPNTNFVRGLQQFADNLPSERISMRYVIAGLHNLARMTTEANSPLGKSESIALAPYNTEKDIKTGLQLITEPMAALGFVFGADDEHVLPWRILSVCNFYPAFIQLYCANLLERLYNNRQHKGAPTLITSADLDAVEHDEQLLEELKRKFRLNLNLDRRYRAIALILADRYYDMLDESQDRSGMTVSEVSDYCETYATKHFVGTGAGSYETLLEEMRKLNVLERSGARYALRNHNIAMMMGDRATILQDLAALEKEEPETSRLPGERRGLMTRGGNTSRIFPLPTGWVHSNLAYHAQDDQLIVLVGNNASGLLTATNEAFDDWQLFNEFSYVHKNWASGRDLESWVRTHKAPVPRLIAVAANGWKPAQMMDFAATAKRLRPQAIRLALVATPDRAVELAKFMTSEADIAVNPAFRIEPIAPWNDNALFYHVTENIMLADNVDARRKILEATAGFGDKVIDMADKAKTPARLAELCAKIPDWAKDKATFYRSIGLPDSISADERKALEAMLHTLHDFERAETKLCEEALSDAKAPKWMLLYAQWMGLISVSSDGKWNVPVLVKKVLS